MISGADRSGHAHVVLSGPAASSGWCAQVPDGAQGSVINPVSKRGTGAGHPIARGLLGAGCNLGIGLINRDVAPLEPAERYLVLSLGIAMTGREP